MSRFDAPGELTAPIVEDSRRSVAFWTVGAGLTLGVAYALSPLVIWFGITVVALFAWAGRGLSEKERRWVWGLLALAIVLRLLLVALLFLANQNGPMTSFFWDGDGVALKRRALLIRSVWLGQPVTPLYFGVAFDRLYGWTTYLYVLAYVQYWLGPAPYAIHLLNIALSLATAVALYRIVRKSYGRAPAFLGLLSLLFMPTPFLWSVSALKESLYLFLEVIGMIATITLVRSRGVVRRAIAVALLVGSAVTIGTVRAGAFLIETVGLAAGLAGSIVVRRVSLVLLVLALIPIAAPRVWNNAAVQTRVMAQLRTAAVIHIGNVRTEGHGYKLLDQRFYTKTNDLIATMTPTEGLRFAIRAIVSFVLVPLPWQVQSASEMVYLPQQIVWYALVAFAFVGFFAGIRRDPLLTCILAGLTAVGACVIALNSGNIGTMVRHRDTIVPLIVWLSALGAVATVSRVMAKRSIREADTTRGQRTALAEASL